MKLHKKFISESGDIRPCDATYKVWQWLTANPLRHTRSNAKIQHETGISASKVNAALARLGVKEL